MAIILRGNGVTLPSPDSITVSDEIVWSANTGRAASGRMLGDVVADKKTFAITWGVLTLGELERVRGALQSGFHPFSMEEDGLVTTVEAYRGTLSAVLLGSFAGTTYYRDVTATVIQQ